MSISQVMSGALTDPASSKHHERANGARTARERAADAAQKERQIGQRPRRAPDAKPSYEAFERAQQLDVKQHVGGASRIAQAASGATTVATEGDPLEPALLARGSEPPGPPTCPLP